ncbi:MAG: lipocalin family protein [Bacteroidales bacterium]|nr:lipocalin family protein [Bacteroidales bacterium]
MKKHIFNAGLVLLVLAVIVTACKKDDDDSTSTKTNKEYLTSGYWKITAMTIDPGVSFGGTTITDLYSQFPSCTKDDIMKFNSDGSITDDEGATKCDVNDPQTTNDGSWVMSQDNKSFTVSYPGEDAFTMTIIEISDTKLKGSYTAVEDWGSGALTYTYTVTFAKQ